MRHRSLRWTALALALSLVGFGIEGQEREPVRIGIVYTNTGPLAQLGIDMRDGALLFWSHAGQRAGGRRVEILTESTGSNKPDEGLTKARKLVERDRAHIYLERTERRNGVLQNVPIATYPGVGQFWTLSPEEYMAMPSYVDLKAKWAR